VTKVWVTLVGSGTENGDEVAYYEIDGGGSFGAAPAAAATRRFRPPIRLGLFLGLLGYGKAPKTAFRLPGLVRKRSLNYGV
jgi:hypothetical protein